MAQEIRKLVIPGFKQLTNFFRMDFLFPAVYLPFNALLLFQILDARHKGKERTQVLNSLLHIRNHAAGSSPMGPKGSRSKTSGSALSDKNFSTAFFLRSQGNSSIAENS